jgi:oligoribonuclease
MVWMDLEMSGLNPETDVILEIATIITDKDLNILGQGPHLVIRQDPQILARMDEWNTKHHNQSGLVQKVLNSHILLQDAEDATLDFIRGFTVKTKNPLCGNSIGQDRRFLYRYMPKLADWLSYRSIDVTTIKELMIRWYPNLPLYEKEEKHQALSDIQESIEELRYYRSKLFNTP